MSLLKVERLSKTFGAIRAVDSVSLEVRPGEIYGLLGPNGAGKTTTLSMICGLLKPDAGEVLVAGAAFWADPQKAKRIMGVVPQDLAIYEELTGRENLEFWGRMAGLGSREARARAAELLEALTLTDRANDAVATYSGGMKRRINLGCALLHRPQLLLLDEPTVGIDPQARLNILEFIRNLRASGTAILYTTHYLEEAETLCQRIGIIDHGRLLAEGTLSQLQERLGGDRVSCWRRISKTLRRRRGMVFTSAFASSRNRSGNSWSRRLARVIRPSASRLCWISRCARKTSRSSGPASTMCFCN